MNIPAFNCSSKNIKHIGKQTDQTHRLMLCTASRMKERNKTHFLIRKAWNRNSLTARRIVYVRCDDQCNATTHSLLAFPHSSNPHTTLSESEIFLLLLLRMINISRNGKPALSSPLMMFFVRRKKTASKQQRQQHSRTKTAPAIITTTLSKYNNNNN